MASVIGPYSFGVMDVGGTAYRSDLIVFPDRVLENWRRRNGHTLDLGDLDEVLTFEPEVLVIGTGAYGVMKVPPNLMAALEERGIEVTAARTGEACRLFNEVLGGGRRVVGAFHITC